VDSSELIFMGHSLGGAIATWLAIQHPPAALVLESTFTSMPAMGSHIFPWLPIGLVARIVYPTIERIGTIRSPLLVMHSQGDERIPFEFGQELFRAAPEPKQFVEIRGNHNDGIIVSGSLYSDALDSFLSRYTGAGRMGKQQPGFRSAP
jgi:pimeloyl-ACP methyl ester carboxylesterase